MVKIQLLGNLYDFLNVVFCQTPGGTNGKKIGESPDTVSYRSFCFCFACWRLGRNQVFCFPWGDRKRDPPNHYLQQIFGELADGCEDGSISPELGEVKVETKEEAHGVLLIAMLQQCGVGQNDNNNK
jgi:hypothetical protein